MPSLTNGNRQSVVPQEHVYSCRRAELESLSESHMLWAVRNKDHGLAVAANMATKPNKYLLAHNWGLRAIVTVGENQGRIHNAGCQKQEEQLRHKMVQG